MSSISGLMFNYPNIFRRLIVTRVSFPGFFLLLNLSLQLINGQEKLPESYQKAMDYLEQRGEVFFRLPLTGSEKINDLSKIISIDHRDKDFIYAYASPKGFDAINVKKLDFFIETPPSLKIKNSLSSGEFPGAWTSYPSWEEYVAFMNKLASSYPELCTIDTIGFSVNNRMILALKISDQVLVDEPEPDFLYTSTIHGDEPVGYVLLLHLAEWLLTRYNMDPHVTDLVNNLQIWINPLANPDAAYFLGNDNIYGAKRYNINNIDLNRNFPDPEEGPHPDGEEYQPETLSMMEFMKSRHFVMSANLHSGAELVNYPWDTWAKFHPDDEWYRFISRQYADTIHLYNSLYMKDMVNGITNGFAWYTIAGGRQDWVNYFIHGREVTIELSHEKMPDPDTLPWFWEYNYRSLLNYMEQSIFGITGIVTDHGTGKPLKAKIEIPGHDSLNSFVWSDSISGRFNRLLAAGAYDVKFTAGGYYDTIITVQVTNYTATSIEISLSPLHSGGISNQGPLIRVVNPFSGGLKISIITSVQEKIIFDLYDSGGRKAVSTQTITSTDGENMILIDCTSISPGLYILKISSPSKTYETRVVKSE
jgi:hypothetical protein